MTIGPLLYTIDDASKLLNVRVSRLRTAVFRREITYVKLAGLLRFRKEDLDNWVNQNVVLNPKKS